MNVEGEQNAAASTSAPSATTSTAAVQARPITSFFRPEQASCTTAAPSTPAAPPAAPPAAAVESTAAVAAGTATGANVAASALAQQPVADSLAAAHTSTAIPHPSSVRQQYNSLQAVLSHLSLPHPLRPPVGVRKCYHTPWFITPPSWPLRAALYHPVCIRYHTPHRLPHPDLGYGRGVSFGAFVLQ